MTRMNKLLAEGDRDGMVEALFRSVEEISDADMAALRSAPLGQAGSPPRTRCPARFWANPRPD